MKILHIGKYYPPYTGGIEKVNYDLVETLNQNGILTDVFCFNHQREPIIYKKNYKVTRTKVALTKFSTPISFTIFRDLKKMYRQYDIIHLHMPNPTAALAFQFLPFKGKIILHWHLDVVKQKIVKVFYKPFQTHLLRKVDSVIVTSPEYLKHSKDLQSYKQKCVSIPLGINPTYLTEDELFYKNLKIHYKGKNIVFSLGRLIYYKGFDYLIRAAKETHDDTFILIGGSGPLKNKLQQEIDSNNLNHKVKLIGRVPDEHLASYYNLAKVFCLPSIERSEAFGIVLIEAMSMGCPLISTSMGSGTSWVNNHDKTGLVVPAKNEKALAKAINQLVSDNKFRGTISENCKSRFQNNFTLKKMTQQTIQLYNDLLSQNK